MWVCVVRCILQAKILVGGVVDTDSGMRVAAYTGMGRVHMCGSGCEGKDVGVGRLGCGCRCCCCC